MKVPNLLTAAKAAVRVVKELVKGNPTLVSQEVSDARLKVCEGGDGVKACDRYDNGQCLECTCLVKLKVDWSTEFCPLNRWPE